MKKRIRLAAMALAWPASAAAQAPAAPPPPGLEEALRSVRHPLTFSPAGIGGEGAPLLREAVAGARFVGVGEDHFTREIPAFTSALCDMMAPQGLAGLVLEVGPNAAEALTPILAAPDREARMAAFDRRYPNAVAFLDGRDDNAMAAHCLKAGGGRRVVLIGLDQEFVGAAGVLLDRILAERLSPAARAAALHLRAEERRRAAEAARTGDPSRLLLISVTDAELAPLDQALARGGTPKARAILAELRASRDIYALNGAGSPDANRVRGLLLKRHLVQRMPARGKLLFKFGDWHLYKGVNPLRQRDLGNFIAETAEGAGDASLHILVLGAKGVHATFGGYAKPLGRAPFTMSDDKDYRWLAAAVANEAGGGAWTLFDLRPLRHRRLAALDPDWRRVLDGYDLLVVIPELSPSETLR
jgi:hypothetical protein